MSSIKDIDLQNLEFDPELLVKAFKIALENDKIAHEFKKIIFENTEVIDTRKKNEKNR